MDPQWAVTRGPGAELYSSAFLLECEDRLEESATAWQVIIAWNEARGQTLETEWPKRELERLHAEITARTGDQ